MHGNCIKLVHSMDLYIEELMKRGDIVTRQEQEDQEQEQYLAEWSKKQKEKQEKKKRKFWLRRIESEI
mgnify:CR=1 FL=1